MATVTIQSMVERWTDPKARPLFKGNLIEPPPDDDSPACCCAQGDVLRCSGFTDAQLREMSQTVADKEVARILGISRAHSVLLRMVNDTKDGCPQDVLIAPGKILGSEWRRVLKFWRHIDRMTAEDWKKAAAAWSAAGDAAGAASWSAAGAAAWSARAAAWSARAAAWAASWSAAGAASWSAAGAAARSATLEIMGAPRLTVFFFLPMFGFKDAAALDALPDEETP